MNSQYQLRRYFFIFLLFFSGAFYCTAQNWLWTDKISGTLDNVGRGVVVDSYGNVYVYAQIKGTVNVGTDVFIASGSADALLVKFDANGNYQWGLQLGGSDQETPTDITIDNLDNIYVTGGFKGTAEFNPASPGGSGELINSNPDALNKNDIYLAKYNSSGTFIWAYQASTGAHNEFSRAISVDGNDIVMVGDFKTEITFDTPGTITATGSNQDIFAAKFDQSGGSPTTSWYKHYSTVTDNGKFLSVHITSSDDIYIGGFFETKMYYETDSCVSAGSTDLVLFKLDDNGNVLWVRQGGGSSMDQINTICSDEFENVYFTGYFSATAKFDVASKGSYDSSPLVSKGLFDILFGKYNRTGTLQFVVGNGDSALDNAYGLCLYQDYVEFSGYYSGTIIVNNDTLISELGNNDTGFLMYDKNGNPIEAHGMRGVLDDRGLSVKFDKSGSSIVTGYFQSDTLFIGSDFLVNATDDLTPKMKDVFIAKYVPPFSASYTKIQNVLCKGGTSGELIVTPFFGTYPFTYEWSHDAGLNDSTASNLPAGIYEVIITDANLKKDTTSIELTEPSVLNITETITDVLCHPENGAGNDGTIDITVAGGTPGYTYSWTTLDGSGVEGTDEDQFTLTQGTYYVEVTDDNGCVKKDTFLVSQPQQIFFNGTKTDIIVPPGSNGAIDLETTGGTAPYTWDWTGPKSFTASTEDLTGLVNAGTYVVNLIDDHSCTADTAITVSVDTMLIAYVCDLQDVQCHGESNGSATVCMENGSGDYTFYWTNSIGGQVGGNNATLSNMPAGTYYCEVTDNVSLKTAEIDPPAIIEEPDAELTLIFDPNHLLCNGDNSGSINLTISGGTLPYSFDWSGPDEFTSTSEDIDSLDAGVYTCIVTDANGCIVSLLNYEIKEPTVLGVNPIVTDVLCYGELTGIAEANASGGTGTRTYQWDDPAAQTSETAEFLEVGTYHVTVTDANGCQEVGTAVVGQPDAPLSLSEVHQDISCNGGSNGTIAISASGGTSPYPSILWDDFAITWTRGALPAGDYGATVTDANGCQEYIPVTLTEPPPIIIDSVKYTDVTGCPGDANGTIIIYATGGSPPFQYSVDDGANWQTDSIFNNLDAGTFYPRVKDSNDCEEADSPVTIVEPDGVEIDIVSFTNTACPGVDNGTITVTAIGGTRPYEYSIDCGTNWQTDSVFTDLAPGPYNIQVKDARPCFTECLPVTISAGAGVQIDDALGSNCSVEILLVQGTGTAPFEYSIDGGINYYSTSTFTSDTLCKYYDAEPYQVDVYVRDANNCMDNMVVNVTSCADICDTTVCEMWEAFTPNNDGKNDVWNLYCQDDYPNMQVRIYNTWGNLVFESARGYPEPWDGTGKNGKELPAGTYFYVIDWGDGTDPSSGTVNIIK